MYVKYLAQYMIVLMVKTELNSFPFFLILEAKVQNKPWDGW